MSGPVETPIVEELTHTNLAVSYFSEPFFQNLQMVNFLELLGSGDSCYWRASQWFICWDFLQKLEFNDKHYTVSLPWIWDHSCFHNHYQQCTNRLNLLQKRLLNSPQVLNEYHSVMQDQWYYRKFSYTTVKMCEQSLYVDNFITGEWKCWRYLLPVQHSKIDDVRRGL